MFDKLEELVEKLEQIMQELSQPDVVNDQQRFKKLMKEQSELTPIVEKYNEYFDFYYNSTSIENQAILTNLDSFLKHNDKKELMKLEETKLMDNITIAIKMSQLN